ncbi:MAG: HEPN domain-containing protein [Candidatus Cryptobacteroides sp.]
MKLNDEERQILVNLEYEKALSFLNQATGNAEIGFWDVVANRLYYSIFHAVSALLINDGYKVGTHKGAILMFGQHYVKEGTFPIEYAKLYSQLQAMREKSDYNCIYQTSEEEITPLIERVRNFIELIGTKIAVQK